MGGSSLVRFGLVVALAAICLALLPLYLVVVPLWNWAMPSHFANGGLDRPL